MLEIVFVRPYPYMAVNTEVLVLGVKQKSVSFHLHATVVTEPAQ